MTNVVQERAQLGKNVGKIVWDKDRFTDNFGNVMPTVYEWFSKEEVVEEKETPQEVLDAEYEREIQLGPIIAVAGHLLNIGVTVEEIIRRLVTVTR